LWLFACVRIYPQNAHNPNIHKAFSVRIGSGASARCRKQPDNLTVSVTVS